MMTDEKQTSERHDFEQQKAEDFEGINHINNMVGADLTTNPDRVNGIKALDDISTLKKFSRILLDLFAVSLNPKIPKNGWVVTNKKGKKMNEKTWEIEETEALDWKPSGELVVFMPDDFFKHFQKMFSDLIEFDNDYKDIGGGDGFNTGRRYTIKDTSGAVQFRYFDPEKSDKDNYASGSPEENYARQKINLKITGDGLQVLRSKGILVRFLKRLYQTFECDVTMFDIACDLFNYNLVPNDFHKLYLRKKYTGQAKLNVMGEAFNPTVYIGSYKGSRTIMLYDKLQESKDKGKSDEPELVEALEEVGGNWFRLEQHFSREQKEAKQAFDYLMMGENIESIFEERLSNFLRQQVERKCRFLSSPRKEKNNERIKTHKKWELILGGISETKSDFAFNRPKLTLDERMDNFKYRSLGGGNLFMDIIEERGREVLNEFLMEVAEYSNDKLNQKLAEESKADSQTA